VDNYFSVGPDGVISKVEEPRDKNKAGPLEKKKVTSIIRAQ
jgi:hypothetical protein